jgi:RimJ/RimL family protein N-acetyltransferase
MHTLDCPRLSLRMFRESDLDAYASMCADPEVMRFLGDGHTLTRPEAWRNIALVLGHWQLRGFGLWAVEERATGLLVGRVGCWRPEGWPGLEIGYATEAALASLNYAFHRLKHSHVISLIHPDNGPSIAVALRLGMRMEGYTQVMDHSVLIYGIDSVSRVPLTQ